MVCIIEQIAFKSVGNGFHFWYEKQFFILITLQTSKIVDGVGAHLANMKHLQYYINNNQSLCLFENVTHRNMSKANVGKKGSNDKMSGSSGTASYALGFFFW